jgi:hypothetical protein
MSSDAAFAWIGYLDVYRWQLEQGPLLNHQLLVALTGKVSDNYANTDRGMGDWLGLSGNSAQLRIKDPSVQ